MTPAPDPQLVASMKLAASLLKHPVPVADLPDYLQRCVPLMPDENHFADADEESPVQQPAATTPGREIVSQYLKRNFRIVTWPAIGDVKGPKEKNWPEKVYTLADYHDGDRTGLLTGVEVSPGKFLHDVDLDWAPGSLIAQALLPPTGFVFGRASKKVSHCFYTLPEALPSVEYRDIDKTMLIELRGTKLDGSLGRQTMSPPSIWSKNGQRELLSFVRQDEPVHLPDAARLPTIVRLCAIGMILAKHLGKNGFGHDVRLAWAGFLLRAGISPDDLIKMGEAMSGYCNNLEVADVRQVVDSTVANLKDDAKKVKGGPALIAILGNNGHAIIARINEWIGRKEGPQLIIHRASDVPDERLEKVYSGRLVRRAFGLLAGPGEGGKGMLLADTSARFTTGEPFPGEHLRRAPANVLICVTEDSMGRVKSRLRAAGADLDRVYFVEGPEVRRGGLTMPSPMMLDDDAGLLVRYAEQIDARALFLETVVEHFGDRGGKAKRSTNNEADVRSALSPFRQVCAMAQLYGLGAIHPRKSVQGSVDDSISGSAAFRNVTRAAHHIYRDPEDESDNPVRLLFTSKSNYLSRRPATLRFQIRSWDEALAAPCQCQHFDCGHEGRVVWEDDLVDERLAEEIWQQIAEQNKPRRDVNVQEAEAFLTGLMQGGIIAQLPKEIFKLADAEGITKAAVKRAKEKLRLVSKKEGFPAAVVGWQVEKEQM